ncbi:MAG: RtcB family protein [Candidatus Latescibacterota bacterium]|nr:MAG: RtcB family protein [Candidatus Latescibacterota bacterium]
MKLVRKNSYLWEIPPEGGMRVPGRIFASDRLIEDIRRDQAFTQVINVAHLPGIVGYSWAMPDIHVGYGFPIGGVAATAFDQDGVISPGGVGYDINCGVRLMASALRIDDIRDRIEGIIRHLFQTIPCGPSPHETGFGKLTAKELKKVLKKGAGYVVEHGLGTETDLAFCEESGAMDGAEPDDVSDRAVERGRHQLGSLGSGNHFLEIGYVERVFEPEIAKVFGLEKGQVTVMIHCGSRGLGHQVCADYLKTMAAKTHQYKFTLPDRQLAAAPLDSDIGKSYFGAMAAAANYAWANRQTLMVLSERALADVLDTSTESLGYRLIYDVCHNIAKIETHKVGGRDVKVCVHRKGATRALPPGDTRIPDRFRSVGQPVLVPGDMGTASYLLVGSATDEEHPFYSSCHGAGRVLSRRSALKKGRGRALTEELKAKGVTVVAKDRRTLAEEMPEAYKDVSDVVDVLHEARITTKVVEIKPIGVIKG